MNGFFCVVTTMGAGRGVITCDSVEGFIEGDVARSKLEEEAGLVAVKLGCHVNEIV